MINSLSFCTFIFNCSMSVKCTGPQPRVSGTPAASVWDLSNQDFSIQDPLSFFHGTLNFNCSTSVQDPSLWDHWALRRESPEKHCFAKGITIAIFFLGEKCLTNTEGPAKNKECKFPWRYNGVMRDGCTDETIPDGRFVGFSDFCTC